MTSDKFRREQWLVGAGMATAAIISIAGIGVGIGQGVGSPEPLGERVAHALRIDLAVAACLFIAIANVARLRFFSAQDIGGSAEGDVSEPVAVARAILQNTLEQCVLAIPVHLILATVIARPMPLVSYLTILFCVGRLLFWAGYTKGAAARALGFGLTFYPTSIGLLVAAWSIFLNRS